MHGHGISSSRAGGNGDSGGPVYGLNGSGQALAAGTLTAISSPFVPCTGVPAGPTRNCSATIFYAPVPAALARYGLAIRGF